MRKRWAILISGRGSNLQAALDLIEDVEISLVVSSRAKAAGILRAKRAGVPIKILSNPIDWADLQTTLERERITHIFLLGFMKLVPSEWVNKWQKRIFNLHPSLLPAFPGLNSIERNFTQGAPMGVTIHEVVPEMDAGPRVLQKISIQEPFKTTLASAMLQISVDEQRLVGELLRRTS